jgi:phage terminase Nu1 subunit (DNA packaging protein)
MSGIELQDVFEPYYAGRKNPMPHEQAAKDKDANREEIGHRLAERAKRSKKLKSAKSTKKVEMPPVRPRGT